MTQCETALEQLLQDIAHEHPSGLRHAEFVTEVLRNGFVNQSRQSMSALVYQAIVRMVTNGVLVRSEDESRGVREYYLARLAII